MQIEARGLIYDSSRQPAERRVTSFPALCQTSRGTWVSTFQVGSQKHALDSTIGLCRSTDGGVTWEQLPTQLPNQFASVAGSLAAAELVEVESGRLMMIATWFDRSDPSRPLFDPASEGILHSKQLRAFSFDDGISWSAWEELPTPGLTGCSLTGPLLEWPNGDIAVPFENQQTFDSPAKIPHSAWLMTSHDRGQTFSAPSLVATDPLICYWDQRVCPKPEKGKFVAAFWTHDRERKTDLAVHLRHGSLEDPSASLIVDTHLQGQIAAPLYFAKDQLLMFVVHRSRPSTMRLFRSRDGGVTWPYDDHLTVYVHDEQALITQGASNIDYAEYWGDMVKWTFGHPVLRRLNDNEVLLSYYAGPPGCLSIHWARVSM